MNTSTSNVFVANYFVITGKKRHKGLLRINFCETKRETEVMAVNFFKHAFGDSAEIEITNIVPEIWKKPELT